MTTLEYCRYLEEERFRARVLQHKRQITVRDLDNRMTEIRQELGISLFELTPEQANEIYRHGDDLWDKYITTVEAGV